jgi:hypothetical protein
MAVRLVHNVGRLKIIRRGKTATDFGKGRGRIALRRLPTSTDEAGTIDTDCLSARGSVIEPAFLRSVNIARRFSGFNSRIETGRRIAPASLISDADILRVDQPTCSARTTASAIAIRRMHFDSFSIFPMQNIRRRRLPPVLNVGLRDAQGFRACDRLRVR